MKSLQENDFHFKSEDVLFQINALEAKPLTIGYFADTLKDLLENIKKGYTSKLARIETDDKGLPNELPFISNAFGFRTPYRYFIAEKDVHIIKKWRAFKDHDEFVENTGIHVGDLISLRLKTAPEVVYETCVTAFIKNTKTKNTRIYFGNNFSRTLDELFNDYELELNDKWQPFGA